MKTFAVDFESYYDKDCTITDGLENYVNHPDFEAYMVSIYGGEDFSWVGHPKDAPWDKLSGHRWLSHNRSFDEGLWRMLNHKWVTDDSIKPGEWHCTADLAAYCGYPRSLKESCKEALGADMSKNVRDNMKGKKWEDMTPEFQGDVALYALDDSIYCYRLWEELSHKWPEWERQLSRETTDMCWAGMPVNADKVDAGITTLHNVIYEARNSIPWFKEDVAALSPIQWATFVRDAGKTPPPNMSKADPVTQKWAEDNPEEGAVLQATWDLRGANALQKKLMAMQKRIRPDGMLPFGMKYFGGHTGRDSGDSGFNVQNMPREGMYGVDLRSMIEAKEGNVLLVADLAQIEARVIAWLAGDKNLLDAARAGGDWYEAMARTFKLYTGTESLKSTDPDLRSTMKAMCLGCQFGMSGDRFAGVTGVPIEEAHDMVAQYRRLNPKITKLWSKVTTVAKRAGLEPEGERDLVFNLPSGREICYRDVSTRNGLSAMMPRGGKMVRHKLWHGLIVENITQALARDVFMDRILETSKAGVSPVLRVHDEGVFEVAKKDLDKTSALILDIFTTPPEWISDLPLGTEVIAMKQYTK